MGDVFPNGAVSLSFDDGWRCSYEQGLPILDEAQLPSTHYIISGCLDDQQFPRYMNVDHLRDPDGTRARNRMPHRVPQAASD